MKDALNEAAVAEELCDYLRSAVLAAGVALEPETRLAELGVDSVALVELTLFIERRYGLALPEAELTPRNLESAAALARCVRRLADDRE